MICLQNEYFEGYKQAHRRKNDTAIVNAGMRVLLDDDGDVIKELCLCYGGMACRSVVATNTAAHLVAKYDIKNKILYMLVRSPSLIKITTISINTVFMCIIDYVLIHHSHVCSQN